MGGSLLAYGIIGTDEPDESRPRFSSVVEPFEVQQLLLEIADSPRRPEYAAAALQGCGVSPRDLEDLGLVRQERGDYVLGFTLLTRADMESVREVGEESARSLAEDVLARRGEIEAALNRYDAAGIDPAAVAFILLGCFSLDWDGLTLAGDKGFAATAPEEGYIPWAQERGGPSLRGLYWGSHNEYLPDVVVTSFGDHFSLPRQALPDSVWRLELVLSDTEMAEPVRSKLVPAAQQALNGMMGDAGRIVLALREGGKTLDELVQALGTTSEDAEPLLELLLELDYAVAEGDTYRATIPVLTAGDLPMAQELRRVGESIVDRWLTANYRQLEEKLSDTSPVRFGVDFAETFTQIWHHIFGGANARLVGTGLFANPYAEERRYKGFIPCVWHPDVWPYR